MLGCCSLGSPPSAVEAGRRLTRGLSLDPAFDATELAVERLAGQPSAVYDHAGDPRRVRDILEGVRVAGRGLLVSRPRRIAGDAADGGELQKVCLGPAISARAFADRNRQSGRARISSSDCPIPNATFRNVSVGVETDR
jgi:hypothetical protein